MKEVSIGFIGAGNMATSLAGGIIAKGTKARNVWMSDPNESARKLAADMLRVQVTEDNSEVLANCDVLVLAVKPQVMKAVTEPLAKLAQEKKPLIISIAAGITIESLQQWMGDLPIVRCMPNTPALVQTGATGLYANPMVDEEQRQLAKDILHSVGIALWVDEEAALDTVTAVSGSGPAYFFLVMEAMIDAGKELGLSESEATQLTFQTALGAAQMAITSDDSAATLRKKVTSPGGTTEQAILTFEQGNLRELFKQALTAAKVRSEELAKADD